MLPWSESDFGTGCSRARVNRSAGGHKRSEERREAIKAIVARSALGAVPGHRFSSAGHTDLSSIHVASASVWFCSNKQRKSRTAQEAFIFYLSFFLLLSLFFFFKWCRSFFFLRKRQKWEMDKVHLARAHPVDKKATGRFDPRASLETMGIHAELSDVRR